MIEYKTDSEIITFDGRVIEIFGSRNQSGRWRIEFVDKAEIIADRKERGFLEVKFKTFGMSFRKIVVTPEHLPQAQALVDEVNKVVSSI